MSCRIARKILDQTARAYTEAGYSRYSPPERLVCRAARLLPDHPMVQLATARDVLLGRAAGRLLDGVTHDGFPEVSRG